jgi:hypothetical protein
MPSSRCRSRVAAGTRGCDLGRAMATVLSFVHVVAQAADIEWWLMPAAAAAGAVTARFIRGRRQRRQRGRRG